MEKKLEQKSIAVIGLGYVGLPLALRCIEKGYQVFGLDLDEKKVQSIQSGVSPFKEEFIEKRKKDLTKIQSSTDPAIIKDADIVLICVPTPVDEQFYPILEPVKSAIRLTIENHKAGRLVVVESTINPGVCEEIVEPIFKENNLTEGKDYYLAHCPERIDPGNKKWNVTNIPRVVGSLSKEGLTAAAEFFESIIDAPIKKMRSIREAVVNELAKSFDQMGIDIKDVIEGAATKPYSFLAHFPGRGVGGHCIPVDPYYLIERAKRNGFDHRFLRTAREINNSMPIYTVELMQNLLNEVKMPMKETAIGVMGLSYKANVDDLRESPAIKIIKELEKKGANVVRYDPFIPKLSDVKNLEEFLEKSAAIILVTNHDEFIQMNIELFKKYGVKAIVDGMNCLDGTAIKELGILYHGIGRQ